MIISLVRRCDLEQFNLGGRIPPKDATKALKELEDCLELIWNVDQWEIYRLRKRGLISGEDELYHQMSSPSKGTGIGPWIKSWLQKFDSNPGGLKDKDELTKKWLQDVHERNILRGYKEEKAEQELYYQFNQITDWLIRNPTSLLRKKERVKTPKLQVRIPVTVGMDRKTGKPVRMA